MSSTLPQLIDGEWRQSQSRDTIDVTDPITGERDRRLFAELGASGDPWVALGADVTNPGVLRVGQPVEWL